MPAVLAVSQAPSSISDGTRGQRRQTGHAFDTGHVAMSVVSAVNPSGAADVGRPLTV